MKKAIKLTMLVLGLCLLNAFVHAQQATETRYSEWVRQNPNAEKDIKAVSDHVNGIVNGDLNLVRSVTSTDFKAYGPSPDDSADLEKTIQGWQENYKSQQNRSVHFLTESFQVLQGDLKGDWVSMWGDYTFSQGGKTIKFPFQLTAHVTDGKVTATRIYYDRLYIIQKLGFTVTPPKQ